MVFHGYNIENVTENGTKFYRWYLKGQCGKWRTDINHVYHDISLLNIDEEIQALKYGIAKARGEL